MNASVDRVRDVLADLVRAALVSDDERSLGFRHAARSGLSALREDPPDAGSLKMEGAWTLAIKAAESPDLQPEEGQVNLTLPRACPFGLDEVLDEAFDIDWAVESIRKSASTG